MTVSYNVTLTNLKEPDAPSGENITANFGGKKRIGIMTK